MTTTTTKPVELSSSDLDELDVDPPREWFAAFRNDADTITFMVPDPEGGSYLDPPNEDHSGEDAWEWIAFDNGRERDEWRLENSVCSECGGDLYWDYDHDRWSHTINDCAICDGAKPALRPTDILIERYEHGLVNYEPIGEASQVDRQWDVAYGVAVVRFTKPETFYDGNPTREQLLDIVRSICDEYTAWCNGDVWGMIRYERRPPLDAPNCPVLIPDEFTHDVWEETDSCWGFVGLDYAQDTAERGDW